MSHVETYLGKLVGVSKAEKLDKHSGLNLYHVWIDSKLYGTSAYHKLPEVLLLAKKHIENAVEAAKGKQ